MAPAGPDRRPCLLISIIALVGSAGRADGQASVGCPCISSWASSAFEMAASDGSGTVLRVSVADEATHEYPLAYGTSVCAAHDTARAPFCADAETGAALADAPGWCGQSWCFVDAANCDVASATSSYFSSAEPALHFSYETCGQANSFSAWFASGGRQLPELIDVVEGYVLDARRAAEQAAAAAVGQHCSAAGTCPCNTCAAVGSRTIDLNSVGTMWRDINGAQCADADACNRTSCIANGISETFLRIAAQEHSDDGRVGYLLFGSHSVGALTQWPAEQWCDDEYDPRFRPWYASAVSGPKQIVLLGASLSPLVPVSCSLLSLLSLSSHTHSGMLLRSRYVRLYEQRHASRDGEECGQEGAPDAVVGGPGRCCDVLGPRPAVSRANTALAHSGTRLHGERWAGGSY